ncbi:hypothetical protein N7494_002542 [Penicillium frequentans]|uniref:Xylanolytic transcriptional activator regulatory domain-containing protein n=1 Tax=Penicillium frequentans TaxID=3151616 RepID=A0AAD6GIV2_9EURO|nr:hypothetical protein N7494_002542 [Penicillium glabrum]
MIVQALECIQLYWFGVGQPHSGNLCLALAYRSCQMLGFDQKLSNENDGFGGSFESELCRRCFWACWTSTCIVMEPEPYIESAWKEVAMLPLPGLISSVSSGCKVSFNQMMNEDWQSFPVRSPSTDSQPATAVGILVKIIGVWAKVQLLCKGHSSSATARNFNSTKCLSSLATSLFNDAAAVRNSVSQDDESPEAQTLLLHDAIYHQCQITLHSMIVPLFSGIPADPTVDTEIQRKAAETVIYHADLFEGLLAPYLYDRMDVSRLPPLVGYGAFINSLAVNHQ